MSVCSSHVGFVLTLAHYIFRICLYPENSLQILLWEVLYIPEESMETTFNILHMKFTCLEATVTDVLAFFMLMSVSLQSDQNVIYPLVK